MDTLTPPAIKAKDIVVGLCEAYGMFARLLNREIDVLKGLDVGRDPTAADKWESFFEKGVKGACADEYLKNLIDWMAEHGSLAVVDVQIDTIKVGGIVHQFIRNKIADKKALQDKLKIKGYLDEEDIIDTSPDLQSFQQILPLPNRFSKAF